MSVTKYEYSIAGDFPEDSLGSSILTAEILSSQISTALCCINRSGDVCEICFEESLSAGDKTVLDGVVESHAPSLIVAKKSKIRNIDHRTAELIDGGFEFPASSGSMFSLSQCAQIKIEILDRMRDDTSAVSYPLMYNTKCDTLAYSIPDSGTMHAFCIVAAKKVLSVVASGTALKDLVRAAITVSEVNTVVDPR